MKTLCTLLCSGFILFGFVASAAHAQNHVLSLDGDGDYVRIGNSLSLVPDYLTIEAWFRPTQTNDPRHIISRYEDNGVSYEILTWTNGEIRFQVVSSSGGKALNVGQLVPGNWYHVAMTFDGQKLKGYLNGTLLGEVTLDGVIQKPDIPLLIGASRNGTGFFFSGLIDEVRIWNKARTPSEILATMTTSLTGKESGLVGYWNFEGDGKQGIDATGHGHDGKLVGDAAIVVAEKPTAVVSGVIRDEKGRALSAAKVLLRQADVTAVGTETDSDGRYTAVLSPGRYDLYATHGKLGAWESIQLRPGGRQTVNLTLKTAVRLEGTTLSQVGKIPLANLTVQALRNGKVISETKSDDQGAYQLVNLPVGDYHIRCEFVSAFTYYPNATAPENAKTVRVTHDSLTQGLDILVSPSNAEGRYELARLLARAGQHQLALEQCQSILAEAPTRLEPAKDQALRLTAQLMAELDGKRLISQLEKIGRTGEDKAVPARDGLKYDYLVRLSQSLLKGQKNLRDYVEKTQQALDGSYAEADPADVVLQAARVLSTATQVNRGQWRVFGVHDGLPSGVVFKIIQDSHGTLWVGTLSGVARFDGVGFDQPIADERLREKGIVYLLEDGAGHLWMWTYDLQTTYLRLHRFNGERLDEPFKEILEEGEVAVPMLSAEKRKPETLWFGTNKGRVLRYRDGGTEVFSKERGLPGRGINALLVDRRGTLWVGTDGKGAYRVVYPESFTSFEDKLSRRDGGRFTQAFGDKPPVNVSSIFEDSSGRLWFGGGDALGRYDGADYTFFTQAQGLPNGKLTVLEEDINGDIWCRVEGVGAVRYAPSDGGKPGGRFVTYTEADGLPGRDFEVTKDRRGVLWFTAWDRIAWYDGAQLRQLPGKSPIGFSGSPYADREGNVWFVSQGLGVAMFDPETMRTFTISDGLPASDISVLLLDREGGLWIGNGGPNKILTGGGLARFDPSANDASDRRMQTWTRTDGLLDNNIYCLYEDSQWAVWIGTGKGLNRYNGKEMTHFTEEDGIPSELILAITADKDGALWIGAGKRLYRYVPTETPAFTQVGGSELHVEGDYFIAPLYVDAAGHLWGGLWVLSGGGKSYLFRYDGQRFTRFSAEDGAPSSWITAISQDSQSRLWVGTLLGGVYVYDDKHFITPAALRQISSVYDLFHDRGGQHLAGYEWGGSEARRWLATGIRRGFDENPHHRRRFTPQRSAVSPRR
jgi:ligand-binding sensor domain-containing protein